MDTIQRHPNAANIYSRQVAELEKALADPEIAGEAAEAPGALIERVVLTPDPMPPMACGPNCTATWR